MKHENISSYAEIMHQVEKAKGRKEAVGLIHKAAKLKCKLDSKKLKKKILNYTML